MSLESASWIPDLVITNPTGPTDPKSQGDDHIRMIKAVLKATFPNLTGAVTATHTELNQVDSADPVIRFPVGTRLVFQQTAAPTGWTKDVTKNNNALRVVSGAVVNGGTVDFTTAFASQAVAGTNTGFTLTANEIPSHAHTQQGSFTSGTVSSDHSHFFSVNSGGRSANHVHSTYGPYRPAGFMSHDGGNEGDVGVADGVHTTTTGNESVDHFHGVSGNTGGISANHTHATTIFGATTSTGGGASHTHTFTGTAINLAVKYTDVIIAQKD